MYVYEGNAGQNASRLFRSDDVATGAPVFTDLTSNNIGRSRLGAGSATATRQCWYDLFVYTPEGHPDIVYAGGSLLVRPDDRQQARRRPVDRRRRQRDGHDDGRDRPDAPERAAPRPALARHHPDNPFQFFETNDGGVMRSSGEFVDRSSWCDDPQPGRRTSGALPAAALAIPSELEGINKGLSTLQFQSLSVSPFN